MHLLFWYLQRIMEEERSETPKHRMIVKACRNTNLGHRKGFWEQRKSQIRQKIVIVILSIEGTFAWSFPWIEYSLVLIMKFGTGVRYPPVMCIKCWLTDRRRKEGNSINTNPKQILSKHWRVEGGEVTLNTYNVLDTLPIASTVFTTTLLRWPLWGMETQVGQLAPGCTASVK